MRALWSDAPQLSRLQHLRLLHMSKIHFGFLETSFSHSPGLIRWQRYITIIFCDHNMDRRRMDS
jgi:hypothetical protein